MSYCRFGDDSDVYLYYPLVGTLIAVLVDCKALRKAPVCTSLRRWTA